MKLFSLACSIPLNVPLPWLVLQHQNSQSTASHQALLLFPTNGNHRVLHLDKICRLDPYDALVQVQGSEQGEGPVRRDSGTGESLDGSQGDGNMSGEHANLYLEPQRKDIKKKNQVI